MLYLEIGKYFGRKEDAEGSKYLGKEVLAWKEGRH
jgi:hypothetical protein